MEVADRHHPARVGEPEEVIGLSGVHADHAPEAGAGAAVHRTEAAVTEEVAKPGGPGAPVVVNG